MDIYYLYVSMKVDAHTSVDDASQKMLLMFTSNMEIKYGDCEEDNAKAVLERMQTLYSLIGLLGFLRQERKWDKIEIHGNIYPMLLFAL